MTRTDFQVVAPDPAKHREGIVDLVAKVFSRGGYFESRDRFRRKCSPRSHLDWEATRIGLADGKVVTFWGVWDYRMRIGSAQVRTGGIGNVATHADYRKRGWMARTARASIAAMRDAGYDLSILYGVPDFYYRFGYVRAWSEKKWIVALKDLPGEGPTARARRASAAQAEEIDALCNREHARLTGTAVRPTYSRECGWRAPWHARSWTDSEGRIAGYVIARRERRRLVCHESGGDPEEVLRVLGVLGRRWNLDEVVFPDLHERHPLAKRLGRGTCRREEWVARRGGPMVLTVNLTSTLEKMSGELGRRLRGSALEKWRGKLLVADSRERVTLAIGRGKVRVADPADTKHALRGGDEVARLLIGSADPAETVEAGRMRLSGDAGRLAAVLFPAQDPRLGSLDRF